MAKDPDLWNAKKDVRDNLETLRIYLVNCVDEGMIDLGDELYNAILALIEDNGVISTWDEMEELLERAKILERDIDVWLAFHGRTSLSLPWPVKKKTSDNK
jgi:hypothetical protein